MKKCYLVSFREIVSGGADGGIFNTPKVVCLRKSRVLKEMQRLNKEYAETYEKDCGDEWKPYTSGRTGDIEGAFFQQIDLIE